MLIDDIAGRRVLVLGDVERVSPEAPVLVVNVVEERAMLGGAANVAANVAALGGEAVLVGAVGEDGAAAELSALVAQSGRIADGLVRLAGHCTTQKTRYLGGDRHLLRADRERIGLSPDAEKHVTEAALASLPGCEVVVISDYAKGVACEGVVRAVIAAAQARGVAVVVDPKRADLSIFKGARLLTPNRKEMRLATGEPCEDDDSCDRAGAAVVAATGAAVLLT